MLKRALPHLTIITAVMIIALLITDQVNKSIQILTGSNFKILLLIFCISGIWTSLILIVQNWNRRK